MTEAQFNQMQRIDKYIREMKDDNIHIQKVFYNRPETIVYWSDGTMTAVKACSDEPFDKEKGLAMAIVKRLSGNTRDYCDEIAYWVNNAATLDT